MRFAQPTPTRATPACSRGTGGIEKTGAGKLTLTRDQAITGTTTISAGTLQLGNGGTTGMVGGRIVDNAALVIHRTDAIDFAGADQRHGQRDAARHRHDDLHRPTTATPAARRSRPARLQLGDGGTTGSVVGNIVNNATLVVNRSNTLNLAGAISGSGALQQDGQRHHGAVGRQHLQRRDHASRRAR